MTLKEVELLIQSGGMFRSLDITRDTNFSFNFQMTDITNPTAVLTPYSAQISLPRTKTNNDIFGHIYRLDHIVSGFNPLIRTDFQLYLAGSLYQTGYMKLESITEKEYKIRLYGGLGDLFYMLSEVSDVRDMRLKSLPFGDFFDHVINAQNIYNWWRFGGLKKTYRDYASNVDVNEEVLNYAMTYQGQYDDFDSDSVYKTITAADDPDDPNNIGSPGIAKSYWIKPDGSKKYIVPELDEHKRNFALSNVGFGEYRSYYQKPVVKFKALYNKIIEHAVNAGWTFNFDPTFFNANNPYWNDLWVLFPQYDVSNEENKSNLIFIGKSNDFWNSPYKELNNTSDSFTIPTGYSENIQPDNVYRIYGSLKVKLVAEGRNVTINDIIGRILVLQQTLRLTPVLTINGLDYDLENVDTGLNHIFFAANHDTMGWILMSDENSRSFYFNKENSDNTDNNTGSVWEFKFDMLYNSSGLGSSPDMSIRFDISGYTGWKTYPGSIISKAYGLIVEVSDSYINIENTRESGIRSGAMIGYGNIVKSEKTCFDLLMSYGKIFGLYYLKDDKSKTIDIVTRKTFFANRENADWTYKIDYSKGTELQPVPFTYKTGEFKWKEIGSKYEEAYQKDTGREYGSLTFDTGYRFSSETKDYIGSIFGNCIVASDYSQYYQGRINTSGNSMFKDDKTLPHLVDKDNSGVNIEMILLFDSGSKDTGHFFAITDDDNTMLSDGFCWNDLYVDYTFSYYRYFTRIFSNENGVYSLNFGRPSVAYNDDEATLIDPNSKNGPETIYSRFWKAYINDIFNQNNKVLTCYVMLSLSDIYSNLFNKFIYINNTVWVVDKIHNFNPMSKAPTKVTLVKVQDVENYAGRQNY